MFWESPYRWGHEGEETGPESDKDNYLLLLKDLKEAFKQSKHDEMKSRIHV